jgi:hypothetical protein
MSPIKVIVWTCAIVFVITALITLLHVLGIRRLPNPAHGNTLFKVLLVEIVVISVTAFGGYLKDQNNITNINNDETVESCNVEWKDKPLSCEI